MNFSQDGKTLSVDTVVVIQIKSGGGGNGGFNLLTGSNLVGFLGNGLVPPKLSAAQISAIPATDLIDGSVVFNTTSRTLQQYDATTAAWFNLNGPGGISVYNTTTNAYIKLTAIGNPGSYQLVLQ